jgi:HEAT repeats/PBS lyase HEAT-like repeat
MKSPRKSLIGVLLVLAGAGLAWYALLPREPEYQGRTLRDWLGDVDSGQPEKRAAAAAALRQMGPKAVPFLMEFLGARGAFPFKVPRMRWVRGGNTYAVKLTPAPIAAKRAIIACSILGPEAKPAIPALARVLKNGDYTHDAATALGKMGPDALPALTNAFTSGDAEARKEAVTIFQRVPYDAQPAIPALLFCLKDSDAGVRIQATQSLASIGKQPRVVVPALMQALADTNSSIRFFAINALRRFGENAKPAMPRLVAALQDADPQVRRAVSYALKQIAPEETEKTNEP